VKKKIIIAACIIFILIVFSIFIKFGTDNSDKKAISRIETYEIKQDGIKRLRSLVELDESGNEILVEYYDDSGSIKNSREVIYEDNYEQIHEYDINFGNFSTKNFIESEKIMESIFTYENDDSLSSRIVYDYDDFGNLIKLIITKSESEEIIRFDYIYDENKKILEKKQTNISNDRIFSNHTVNRYDGNRLISFESTSSNGLFPPKKTVREYDIFGSLKYLKEYKDEDLYQIKEYNNDLVMNTKQYNNNVLILETKNEYFFENNNWIQKNIFQRISEKADMELMKTVVRVIFYYE
jgi:hypothetical protein